MTVNRPGTPMPAPSKELLQAAKGLDPAALERLLSPHWEGVYRLAYRFTGHAEDAQDLAQEAFVRIIRQLPSYREECAFSTWVYRVAANVCLTARNRKRDAMEDVDEHPVEDTSPGPEAQAMESELREKMRQEIGRLHPAYREAVSLRLLGEMSYEEMAAALHVSVNTARLRVSRGMKRLRESLKPWLDDEVTR